MIKTTGEHPFYVYNKGWIAAAELRPNDILFSHDGQWVSVEEVYDTGEYSTVYNLCIADFHTYFVGGEEWGFSVWAHNAGQPYNFVADAGVFLDKVPGGAPTRSLLNRVINKAKNPFSIVLPKAIKGEVLGVSDLARLAGAKATITERRSANVKQILAAHPGILSKKFGENDLKLVATAQALGLPIVTVNSKLKTQIEGHADRKALFGGVKILVPGQDFSSIPELRRLTS